MKLISDIAGRFSLQHQGKRFTKYAQTIRPLSPRVPEDPT